MICVLGKWGLLTRAKRQPGHSSSSTIFWQMSWRSAESSCLLSSQGPSSKKPTRKSLPRQMRRFAKTWARMVDRGMSFGCTPTTSNTRQLVWSVLEGQYPHEWSWHWALHKSHSSPGLGHRQSHSCSTAIKPHSASKHSALLRAHQLFQRDNFNRCYQWVVNFNGRVWVKYILENTNTISIFFVKIQYTKFTIQILPIEIIFILLDHVLFHHVINGDQLHGQARGLIH